MSEEIHIIQVANVGPQMPNYYRAPLMLPLRWQDEQSGVLPTAVLAFLDHGIKQRSTPPTEEQLKLICGYLKYYIDAPCWQQGDTEELDKLRKKAKTLKTGQDINDFIWDCMEIGIDPL